jgi:hypothetical protein
MGTLRKGNFLKEGSLFLLFLGNAGSEENQLAFTVLCE